MPKAKQPYVMLSVNLPLETRRKLDEMMQFASTLAGVELSIRQFVIKMIDDYYVSMEKELAWMKVVQEKRESALACLQEQLRSSYLSMLDDAEKSGRIVVLEKYQKSGGDTDLEQSALEEEK